MESIDNYLENGAMLLGCATHIHWQRNKAQEYLSIIFQHNEPSYLEAVHVFNTAFRESCNHHPKREMWNYFNDALLVLNSYKNGVIKTYGRKKD